MRPSVTIDGANFGTVTIVAAQLQDDIDDWFAPEEYLALDKSEKIAGPSFELLPAGKRISVGTLRRRQHLRPQPRARVERDRP